MKKFLFILAFIFLPHAASAAEFYFSYDREIVAGESIITLRVNTKGEKVNALSGEIALPVGETPQLLSGDSVLLLWVESPHVKDGKIVFSGVTPGGFVGDVPVLSFVLSQKGKVTLDVGAREAYVNDERGTPVTITSKKSIVNVLPARGNPYVSQDVTLPEPFIPLVSNDPGVYDGAYFITFATQDKGSGIKGYEWSSSYFMKPDAALWGEAVAPLFLPTSVYFQKIYIKAIDNSGNERVVSVYGPYAFAARVVGGILIASVLILCVLYFARSRSRRYS